MGRKFIFVVPQFEAPSVDRRAHNEPTPNRICYRMPASELIRRNDLKKSCEKDLTRTQCFFSLTKIALKCGGSLYDVFHYIPNESLS
jgi:hypothetical protein